MGPEFRQRVDSLLEAALSRNPSERDDFVREACQDDPELLGEVSSLIHTHEKCGAFLETPSSFVRIVGKSLGWDRPSFPEGGTLLERFEIVRLLDRGGMGEVYEALDRHLNETVALKTIRPELLFDTKAVELFHREVRLARHITHRNVCRIHDIFRSTVPGAGEVLFLTMEYLEGESLARRLEREKRIGWRDAIPILIQVLEALEEARRQGVVHRDLKPENIVLVPEGEAIRAVVTDFGLAVLAEVGEIFPSDVPGSKSSRASSRAAWGTPAYMSPEQLRGESVDHSSDLFSFGVIAYELLAGAHPYSIQGDQPLRERFRARLKPVHDFDMTVPRSLERIIVDCLALEPGDRARTAANVLGRLKRVTTSTPVRRTVLITALSLAGGGALTWGTGPLVANFFGRRVRGPRMPSLEAYIRSPKALEAFREALERVRDGANIEAIPYLQEAIAVESSSILCRLELVQTLLDIGEGKKASEELYEVDALEATTMKPFELALMRALRARSSEDYRTASDELRALVQMFPDDLHLALRYARQLEESGEIEEVRPLYESMADESFAASLGLGRAIAYAGVPSEVMRKEWLRESSLVRPISLEAQGMVYSVLGVISGEMKRHEDAIEYLRLSLDYREKAGDRRGEAVSLSNLAAVYRRLGQTEEVFSLLERALKISREMEDTSYEAYTLSKVAMTYVSRGEPKRALDYYRQAIAIEWTRQEHTQLGPWLNMKAQAHALMGQYEDARMALVEAAKHIAPSGQKDHLAYTLVTEGRLALARGDFKSSVRLLAQAEELFSKHGFEWGLPLTKSLLAQGHAMRGSYTLADDLLQESSRLHHDQDNKFAVAEVEIQHAALHLAQRAFDAADETLSWAEGRLRGISYYRTEVQILLVKGELALARGRHSEAEDHYGRAVEVALERGFEDLQIDAKLGKARVAGELAQYQAAISSLMEAREAARRIRVRPSMSAAELCLSQLRLRLRDFGSAVDAATAAVHLAREMGLRPILFEAMVVLGQALFQLGQLQEGAAASKEASELRAWIVSNAVPTHRAGFEARLVQPHPTSL